MADAPASSNPNGRRAFFATAAALAAAGLSGCVVVPYGRRHGPYAQQPAGRDQGSQGGYDDGDEGPVVNVAPPPLQVEVVPYAPGPAYVWIGGYWGWNLGRHIWIGGRWALPPGRGYAWSPGRWNRYGPGWRWQGGRWGRG